MKYAYISRLCYILLVIYGAAESTLQYYDNGIATVTSAFNEKLISADDFTDVIHTIQSFV
jgi:hypothetical protein